jgi:hypothetical protein
MPSTIRSIHANYQNSEKAIEFYNHLDESDSQTFHNKALTYREINLEKSALCQLVLGLCSNTNRPHRATQLDPTKS